MISVEIVKKCGTCNHRDKFKVCHSEFICTEDNCLTGKEDSSLQYPADEFGGSLIAGDDFCCIHWERK